MSDLGNHNASASGASPESPQSGASHNSTTPAVDTNSNKNRTETVASQSTGVNNSGLDSNNTSPRGPPDLTHHVSLTTEPIENQAKNRLRHSRDKSLTQPASIDNPPATKKEIWSWYLNDCMY